MTAIQGVPARQVSTSCIYKASAGLWSGVTTLATVRLSEAHRVLCPRHYPKLDDGVNVCFIPCIWHTYKVRYFTKPTWFCTIHICCIHQIWLFSSKKWMLPCGQRNWQDTARITHHHGNLITKDQEIVIVASFSYREERRDNGLMVQRGACNLDEHGCKERFHSFSQVVKYLPAQCRH